MHTNKSMGARLDLVHSTISRFRSGERLPSIATMQKIEKVLGWRMGPQIAARQSGQYAEKFEAYMRSPDPTNPLEQKTSVPS